MTSTPGFIPFQPYRPEAPPEEAAGRFCEIMRRRRSVRMFSEKPVDRAVIERIIAAAGTAPSGANKQPWRFVAVQDPALKHEIRLAAEEEERAFYRRRAGAAWLKDLAPLGTDEHKPFLELAPWLIAVFKLMKDVDAAGRESEQVYYVNESVGIAVGLLLAAAHHAGLATLTHTPSPMKFLAEILRRPDYERPYLLIPVGYPAEDCIVPDIHRKKLEEIMVVDRG
ncbi:MAG: nitroreductase family protein [Planctomycetota bacterium]|nr:nitroreductase family protein [Planctomycetota bacterium]